MSFCIHKSIVQKFHVCIVRYKRETIGMIEDGLLPQGLTLAIVGPTLLDISELLKISVAQMSYVAFSGDFGAFVGSFLGEEHLDTA